MTIEKAIELITTMKKVYGRLFPPDEQDALSLLIEAGKNIKDFRLTVDGKPIYLLPGETKD